MDKIKLLQKETPICMFERAFWNADDRWSRGRSNNIKPILDMDEEDHAALKSRATRIHADQAKRTTSLTGGQTVSYQPQQPDEEECLDFVSCAESPSHTPALLEPVSPCLNTSKPRKRSLVEFTYFPRRVRFENHNHDDDGSEEKNPLKVSAIVCGFPILTEREADYRLSQSVEEWKKLLFLLSNAPYIFLAFASLLITKIDHRSFHPSLDPLCESTVAHCALACMVSMTSLTLHSSQVRVGHWCCGPAKTRTFHRRRVQDRLDLADCFCASLAVILTVLCHGVTHMGAQMAVVVPIFVASIIVKKMQWWNTYMVIHGLWHVATAYLLMEILVPPNSPIRFF